MSGLNRSHATYFPAACDFSKHAMAFWSGEVPDVVEHEAVSRIVVGKPVGRVKIQRVQRAFKAGGVIQGLALSIRCLKLQPMREAFLDKRLERVVV